MMPSSHPPALRRGIPSREARWLLLSLAACLLAGGCSSLSMGRSRRGPDRTNLAEIGGRNPGKIAGPTERKLSAGLWAKEKSRGGDTPDMAQALARYDAACALYEQKRYSEAEKSFKQLAKDRRATYESFAIRWQRRWGFKDAKETDPYAQYGDPVEEDAMFMIAESQFAQQKYSWAQDSYDSLLERYPSTRHMEPSTQRLFRIAMYWLEFSREVGDLGDVQLTKHESIDPAKPPKAPSTPRLAIIPNVTDRSRPVFDTHGRALQALRSIWLHDAAGPLADDALMLSANHHLRTGDPVEAARLYKLLREQYPDSPFFQDAHLLGAYVTYASYEGPQYDGRALQEAKELKTVALQLFPNLTEDERERLQKDVQKLRNAEIARLWDLVDFYKSKNQPDSVALHCQLIINRFPDSPYAEKARAELAKVQPRPAKATRKPAPKPAESPAAADDDGDDDNQEFDFGNGPYRATTPAPQQFPDVDANPVELPGHIEIDEDS
ncbi:MAG: tetratricopeptide repeat protein [Planctomyces sp.]|nr:tetratricopeptide repeat protein [Planctomyces sp.]